jgi:uncharacterized membrane protein
MAQDFEFNSGSINPGDCISGGWDLIKDDYWLFLGISLVAMILAGCIPCVSIFISGPVTVGVMYCLLSQIRRQQRVEFGMMFKGFENIVPAMVVGIIAIIPEIVGQILRFTVDFARLGIDLNQGGNDRNFYASQSEIFTTGLGLIAIVIGIVFFFIAIAWRITFFFALPLLADHPELEIAETIKLSARAGWSNWGMIIVLSILQGLVALAGMLALCVGYLFVAPIIQASNAIAYRQVFPEYNRNDSFNVPPPPTVYANQF